MEPTKPNNINNTDQQKSTLPAIEKNLKMIAGIIVERIIEDMQNDALCFKNKQNT